MSEQIDSLYSFIANNRIELEDQIYKLKDKMEEHSDYLKDILKTTNEILDTIEDRDDEYKEYHNSLKDPQYLYKKLYEYYVQNDPEEQAEELRTLCRIHRYDYRLTILTYETKFYKSSNISDEESI